VPRRDCIPLRHLPAPPLDFILADPLCQRVMCSLLGRLAACHRLGTNISREVLVHIETEMTPPCWGIPAIGQGSAL